MIRIKENTKKGYVEINNGECVDISFINSKTRRGRAIILKSNCMTTSFEFCKMIDDKLVPFSVIDLLRLQTLPENYIDKQDKISSIKRALGNVWNVETVCHIFKNLT